MFFLVLSFCFVSYLNFEELTRREIEIFKANDLEDRREMRKRNGREREGEGGRGREREGEKEGKGGRG